MSCLGHLRLLVGIGFWSDGGGGGDGGGGADGGS